MTDTRVRLAVSRRSALVGFGTVLAGVVVGFVAGRSTDAATGGRAPGAANAYGYAPAARSGRRRLTDLAAVGAGLVLAGPKVVVVQDPGGAVHAFSATCTHQGCTVSSVRDGLILCPCHGSAFDVRSGAVRSGPAQRGLPPVPVVVEGGVVYAT